MKPKILLVDDREDNLLAMEAILAPSGYQFVKAGSGRHALKILMNESDFAMILMDVKMPNLNGFETAELIHEREKLKHIPIIFITANSYGEENMYKGYKAGAIDYIFKPINPEVLRAKVGILVDLYMKNALLFLQEQKLIAINKNLEQEIFEHKSTEEKVRELNTQLLQSVRRNLESANRDIEGLALIASHDLLASLLQIKTLIDTSFVKHKDLFRDDPNGIASINSVVDRMHTLLGDIIAFSKISLEKSELVLCDLNALLKELVSGFAKEMNEKRATISISNLPSLYVSPRLMRPLFQNLINNALKYQRGNVDPVINIYSEPASTSDTGNVNNTDQYTRIFVEDNGKGFDEKYVEEIFSIFRKLDTTNEHKGTGMGLAVCKKILEQHRGSISARSKVNEGSTFIISLPATQATLP